MRKALGISIVMIEHHVPLVLRTSDYVYVLNFGTMLAEGRSYLGVADQITLFPGLALFITVLAFNLLGDGLRDALDQKLR